MGNHKKAFTIGILLIILLSFPILLFTLRTSQDTRQHASEPTTVIEPGVEALVGGEKITKEDVDAKIMQDQVTNSDAALDNTTLRKKKLDELIEEKLVRQEAAREKVSASSSDVTEKKQDTIEALPTLIEQDPSQVDTDVLSFSVLQEKVRKNVVSSRTVDEFVVNKAPADPKFKTQLEDARQSLEMIRGFLQQGTTAEQAYQEAKKDTSFDTNIQLVEQVIVEGDSPLLKRFKDAIFALKKNDVSQVVDSFGGTLMLVKVTDATMTTYNSYEDWLTAMKKQYVTLP
jgi:hypothetical protein